MKRRVDARFRNKHMDPFAKECAVYYASHGYHRNLRTCDAWQRNPFIHFIAFAKILSTDINKMKLIE